MSSDTRPWRRLYFTKRWMRLRSEQLSAHPLCAMCLGVGRVEEATVVDHVKPHRGDPHLFFEGQLQSLCKIHHDRTKQAEEHAGYSLAVGIDGFPLDPDHPLNIQEHV